jgi:hypothetical protein
MKIIKWFLYYFYEINKKSLFACFCSISFSKPNILLIVSDDQGKMQVVMVIKLLKHPA